VRVFPIASQRVTQKLEPHPIIENNLQ